PSPDQRGLIRNRARGTTRRGSPPSGCTMRSRYADTYTTAFPSGEKAGLRALPVNVNCRWDITGRGSPGASRDPAATVVRDAAEPLGGTPRPRLYGTSAPRAVSPTTPTATP